MFGLFDIWVDCFGGLVVRIFSTGFTWRSHKIWIWITVGIFCSWEGMGMRLYDNDGIFYS